MYNGNPIFKSRIGVLALTLVVVAGGSATAGSFITGAQIKNGSITGIDVRNHSLTPTDFHGSVRGPQGVVGDPGPAGPAGITATGVYDGPVAPQCVNGGACQVGGSQVACPPGLFLLSGGYVTSNSIDEVVTYDAADSTTTYGVVAINRDNQPNASVMARIVCAQAGGRRRTARAASTGGFERALRAARLDAR